MARFGKHPPKIDYRTLRLRDYIGAALAAPPSAVDQIGRVLRNLGVSSIPDLFPLDGNDRLGDCTIAGIAHAITLYRGLVDRKSIMPAQSVINLYYHLTGGVDSGLPELDVLKYFQSHAIYSERLLAFVAVDPKNHTHVQQAIQLFGGLYIGFQVQQNCIADFDARRTWTPGPLTHDGHAVFAGAYDADTVTVLTWGNTQKGTWAWWDECVDEAYALLPADARSDNFAPGFDFAQLQADIKALAVNPG